MTVEHHDLHHEFPEYNDKIHTLKIGNHHFRRLFDEYHELTKYIEAMENETNPASTSSEEELKLRRVKLKDELYSMLRTA